MIDRIASHPLFMRTSMHAELARAPLGFLDIGARGGAHPLVEPLAKLTAVLGFEPDAQSCAQIMADNAARQRWAMFELEPVALSDKQEKATLHLLSAPTNHSLRPPNTDFTRRYVMPKWEEVGSEPLDTQRLDAILFAKRAQEDFWGELMKIDTQGTEYEILEGAAQTLRERTVAIVTEVAFCELYKGQKLFSDVEQLLRGHGFSFYGFHTFHTRSRRQIDKRTQRSLERAMYADAVFFKDPLPGAMYNKPLAPRQNLLLCACALLMGYYDFALEIAEKTWADATQMETMRALVAELASCDPKATAAEVEALQTRIRQSPDQANLLVGKFVDARRMNFDYDDVII
jgi:FkbM family methyltransferase